jgi:D-alanyl-D-alanine carboxypeptidase
MAASCTKVVTAAAVLDLVSTGRVGLDTPLAEYYADQRYGREVTAYRILMVWVYDRTESLLLATLMHGSLIASTAMPILVPPVTGGGFLTWFFASAASRFGS